MNFFKRGLASVTRRKGKSLILFAVIFILGNVMAGAIAIDQGTKSVETTIKKKLGSIATVTQDSDKIMEDSENGVEITEAMVSPSQEVYDEIGKLDQVNFFDYSVPFWANTGNLISYQPDGNGESIVYSGGGSNNYFSFKGVNFNEVLDIKNKIIELKDGRVFEKEDIEKGNNVVLISDEVAKANNVRVGDKITVDMISSNGVMVADDGTETELETLKKDFQVEVIGLFSVLQSEKKEGKKEDSSSMFGDSNYMDRVNTIYAANDYVSKIATEFRTMEFEKNPEMYGEMTKEQFDEMIASSNASTATFTLKSPEVIEAFRIEANKILEREKVKYSKVLVSSDQYDQVAGPVKGMSKISKLVLIISVLASVLIITLVTILFLRDRKHELGIYLSLGETRAKVIAQIVLEVVVVAFIAITISVFTGNMLAKGFSNSLIQTQKTEVNSNDMYGYNQDDWTYSQLSNNNVSEDDVIEAYNISLNTTYILLFYVVGIGVVLVSTVAPLIYIMRLNPKKIMM